MISQDLPGLIEFWPLHVHPAGRAQRGIGTMPPQVESPSMSEPLLASHLAKEISAVEPHTSWQPAPYGTLSEPLQVQPIGRVHLFGGRIPPQAGSGGLSAAPPGAAAHSTLGPLRPVDPQSGVQLWPVLSWTLPFGQAQP